MERLSVLALNPLARSCRDGILSRRDFIAALGGAVVAWTLATLA
jgi:hypothetical protein